VLPLVLFAGLAALFAFALGKGDPSKLPSALIGRPAPALVLAAVPELAIGDRAIPGLTGQEFGSGQPTIVNFWASWCLPCVEEHRYLMALARRAGATVIGVNHKDRPENARKFLAEHGNPFSAVGADQNGRGAIEWGVYGMPETFVVDVQGRIAYKHVGQITSESLEKRLMPAIEKARVAR
jgi:cytochrome c biogenesis protein CcmG, thiol:disulfide interchange protein DsbE